MANSLVLSVVLVTVVVFAIFGELSYLSRYREHLLDNYSSHITLFFGCLFVNIFAAVHTLHRKFFLKDAGQKLSHLDRELHEGSQLGLPAELEKTFGRR